MCGLGFWAVTCVSLCSSWEPLSCASLQVLAGALKDNGRARIVGEPTFGKGLIQTLVPLSDGAALAVTVGDRVGTYSQAGMYSQMLVGTL